MIRRFILPVIALLGLVAIFVAPQTGWLARMQVKMAWLNRGEAEIKRLNTPPEPVATSPAMEAAWKLNTLYVEKDTWQRNDLESLVARYVQENREPPKSASAEEILQLCIAGEKDDPNNAFFTLLRGAALLALHKDAEALEALHLATQKAQFDSYGDAALRDMYRQLRAQGAQGLTEIAMPLYVEASNKQGMWQSNLRFFFRGVMGCALKRQVAGDLKGSIAIRQDLRRIYDLQNQKGYLNPRYGEITQLSPLPAPMKVKTRGSGGGPVDDGHGSSGSATVVERAVWMGPILPGKQRLPYYSVFLRENGYAQEAQAFEKSLALSKAKQEARKAQQEKEEDSWSAMGHMHKMSLWAWGGLLLLASAITTLSCGILARVLLFTQQVEVSKKGRVGALLIFLILVPLIGSAWHGPMDNTVMAWVEYIVQPCYAAGDSEPEPWYANIVWSLERWGSNMQAISIALAPVWLAHIIGGIWALVKRRPLGQGVLGGVWRACVPMAAVTLLVWCGGVVWLANEEARQLARFSEVLQSGF